MYVMRAAAQCNTVLYHSIPILHHDLACRYKPAQVVNTHCTTRSHIICVHTYQHHNGKNRKYSRSLQLWIKHLICRHSCEDLLYIMKANLVLKFLSVSRHLFNYNETKKKFNHWPIILKLDITHANELYTPQILRTWNVKSTGKYLWVYTETIWVA